jgi:DNA-binding LacI/PurR family transcriptional regulator
MNKAERKILILQMIEQAAGHLLETRELAERFGVSEMTVRRDLQKLSQDGLLRRQHGGAMPAPRRRDLRHTVARGAIGILRISRTGKYSEPFFNAFLEGTDRKLQELGYHIAYINTQVEVNTAEQVQELLQSHPVGGMILVGPPLSGESLDYLKANMRVLVGTVHSMGVQYDTITFDGYYGIQQMVDHLVRLGHRRLGFITGQRDFRWQGFVDAVAAHGLPTDESLRVSVSFGIEGWTRALGHIGAEQLMKLSSPPDAIVCASDLIAIGAMQWLHQHQIRVPDDIAVTGFDDITESNFTIPPLTTVHVHKQYMGELAAERIVKRIEDEDEIPLFIQTPTYLVVRESCGSKSAKRR